jgi:hypothetical protein
MLVGMSYEPAGTELKQLIDRWTFGPGGRVRTDHQFVA